MTSVVVTNVFGPLNRGDHELFKALLDQLTARRFKVTAVARDPDLCRAAFPGFKFHEQPGKADTGPLIVQRIRRVLRLVLSAVAPGFPFVARMLPARQRSAVEAIMRADLVVACPGGYLEDSRLSLYPQLVQLWIAAMSRRRLVLAPMSIGPIEGRLPRRLLKKILSRAERVFVRELASEAFCRGLDVNPVVANDLAFLNERFADAVRPEKRVPKYFAVTAINWSFPGTDVQRSQGRYVDSLVAAIEQIAAHTGLGVKLIVQVQGDLKTIELVADKLRVPAEIVRDVDTPARIQRFLEDSYCLIASRFHSAIFALAVDCPVVALAYLPKTTGMLTLYGMDDLAFPIDGFDPDEVGRTVMRWADDRAAFARRCRSLRGRLRDMGDPFGDCLDAVAESTAIDRNASRS